MDSAPGTTLKLGRVLFKFRSITPLPVLAVLAWLLWRSRGEYGPGGALWDGVLDVVGVLLTLSGEALRFYVVGWVPDGTSGQTNKLEAVVLNTTGPYAFVRNPLYVGNFFICLGLLCIAHEPWVYLLSIAFFFGEYFFIIRAEEDFLRSRFGAVFDDYCAKVPKWVPRLSRANEGSLRNGTYDWRRALKKEHNPIAAWATGMIALFGWEHFARKGFDVTLLAVLVALEAMLLVVFAVIKAWKHGRFAS